MLSSEHYYELTLRALTVVVLITLCLSIGFLLLRFSSAPAPTLITLAAVDAPQSLATERRDTQCRAVPAFLAAVDACEERSARPTQR